MDFTIITQGQRVRDIRKKLNLKQEDLSGDIITRNLISMIETDKASLTPKAAEVIHNNLKRFIKERKIEIDVNIDEIFITEEDQAKRIYEDFLKYIDDVGVEAEELLGEMISIINKYELNYMKVYIYGDLGRAFGLKHEVNSAANYYLMANEFAKMCNVDSEYYGKLKGALTHFLSRLGKYEDGIRECNNLSNEIPYELTKGIIYNKIIMLKKIGKYNEALKEIDGFENEFIYREKELDSYDLQINIQIIKGNCYREQGYLNKALRVYRETLDEIKDNEECFKNKMLVLSNIMEVSTMLEDDFDEYLNKLVEEIGKNKVKFEKNYFASEIYKWMANSYEHKKEKNNMQLAYEYTLKSLKIAKRHRNMDIIDYDINKLIEYIPYVKECTIEVVQKHILSLVQTRMIKSDSKVILRLINFHMVNNNQKEAKNIIDFCKSQVS
ncbi:helix-turn-helix domain-containing protein [Oceanirhabdus seepicola]|uniref:Helix-turn-helix transcriptional regulator n=1 Tax=Oceanirhabdus seepicola TaxID=2828781 RepID=A0A9J6NWD1_9CLOT|nr:helix-turn-helix transcriptional regulator [Oceanirhabdus seepicola]MCM1988807.1 helix-turn-helix transcriptional regulator [Oceanirhabdus seepicola]